MATASTTPNPGFKARITSAGLTYANQVAIQQLSKRVEEQTIPEISGDSGGVSYSIRRASITNFTPPPNSSLVLVPNEGLKWSASGIRLAMRGHFKVKYKRLIRISDHGSLDVSISGVAFTAQAIFGVDSNGRPSIRAGSCTSDIDHVSVHFHGRIVAWVLNAFRRQLGDRMKHILKGKMREWISDSLNKSAEKSLSKLQVTTDIGKDFVVDYRLVEAPVFSSNFMETKHKGEMCWKNETTELPFQASPLPNYEDSSRMLYLWVSDYMMNSLLFQAQQHNFLHYNLTANDLPVDIRSVLNTTCEGLLCIGTFIPQLQNSYPNCQVGLYLKSTTVPKVGVVDGTVVAIMEGTIDMYAYPIDKKTAEYYRYDNVACGGHEKPVDILTMKANMTLTVDISLSDQLLHYKVKDIKIPVSLMRSSIPNIKNEALNFIINSVVKIFVEPKINKLGQTGIPLPLNGKVTFRNAELHLLQNSLVVATDLVYDQS